MTLQDTIAAIATPIGEGAIALVRMSGPDSLPIARRIFAKGAGTGNGRSADLKPNHAYFGKIIENDELIDEVILTWFRAPKSYTKEDMVEITCHGGVSVVGRILTATLHCGARLADPGEFTRRAFLNGRIDLTQAEAVAELITANSELARRSAINQLNGSLKAIITEIRAKLVACLSEIEAAIDFPEEGISSQSNRALNDTILSISASLDVLRNSATYSNSARSGFRVAIVGLPNVGKSSLLNAMLGKPRAIVSPVPGTTRDTIEEILTINGIPFRLIDTAGIRETYESVERQGIERTEQAVEEADVVLLVSEAGRPLTEEEQNLIRSRNPARLIVVHNKSDLSSQGDLTTNLGNVKSCLVSAKTGEGMTELKQAVCSLIKNGSTMQSQFQFLTNARHQSAIGNAKTCLTEAINSMSNNMPVEIIASDLRLASNHLGEVVGVITTEDLLDSIFSSFCIGK